MISNLCAEFPKPHRVTMIAIAFGTGKSLRGEKTPT